MCQVDDIGVWVAGARALERDETAPFVPVPTTDADGAVPPPPPPASSAASALPPHRPRRWLPRVGRR